MSFRDRFAPKEALPPRTERESAPDPVRRLLLDLLESRADEEDSYEILCGYLRVVPAESWGLDRQDWVRMQIDRRLEWWQIYELIERAANWTDEERVETVFAENGIGYQLRDGKIDTYEPEADEAEVGGVEDAPLARTLDPQGRFKDPKDQYRRGLEALRQRPFDLESAVANAVNAVEGTVTIITGEKALSAGLKKLYASDRTPLRLSIEQLHNYGSAVPGVRHGAHAPSNLNEHEARYVVRAAGSAMAYLIAAEYEGLL